MAVTSICSQIQRPLITNKSVNIESLRKKKRKFDFKGISGRLVPFRFLRIPVLRSTFVETIQEKQGSILRSTIQIAAPAIQKKIRITCIIHFQRIELL